MSLKQKNSRLITVPDDIIKLIRGAQEGFFDSIIEILSKLETVAGSVTPSEYNLRLLGDLFVELDKVLLNNPEYTEALKKYSREIAEQANINDEYFKSILEDYQRPDFATTLVQNSRKRAMELLLGKEAEAALISPIKDILNTAVSSGNSFAQTVKSVREFALGSGEKESKLLRYTKQIVYDNFAINDSSYTAAVSKEMAFEWFTYSGNIIKSTRQFCEDMLEVKYFHLREIQDLGEGINVDGKSLTEEQLKGRHEGTNKDTIMEFRGGYQCRHNWMPVSVFDVPQEVINRAKSKGYYKS